MNVTFACPKCEEPARIEIPPDAHDYACPHCAATVAVPTDAVVDGKLARCVVCPGRDLFVRKDFPQRLGVGIVVVGFVASSIPWALGYPIWTYVILFATALLDVLLFLFVPECLMCYRCGAIYRGAPGQAGHEAFDLETHEKHRQQKIRLQEAKIQSGRLKDEG
ncbi:MAG: hypothetical protein QM811_25205 [Pirellulales bacterium]